ncbi:BRCA1-A complex subunit RAP80 [Synchiropus splendidus]|uniref:BRCA1-A complex subunit RAP80 n=1 Tax=Synchiropus splendidus TaxID=270530 RepID=UPI00237E84EC|nr:BRCA1-A complex subunit RAP80 [Synchiropus splendidus]
MTEDEMMQLALRLSEQEAGANPSQEEEGDVSEAVHQSMVGQTPEQSLLKGEPDHRPVSSGLELQQRACDVSHADQDFPFGGFISSNCSLESLSPSHRSISPTFPRTPCSPLVDVRGTGAGKTLQFTNSPCGPSGPERSPRLLDKEGLADSVEMNHQAEDSEVTVRSYDMTLRWSDEDEDVRESRSPVFHQETGSGWTPATANGPGSSSSSRVDPCVDPRLRSQGGPAEGQPTVQYYWGVPFCPRSLDPDEYTQVIVTQLDTYSRSLKEARRLLLRKAQWSDGVLPETNAPSPPQTEAEASQQIGSGDDGNQGADVDPGKCRDLDEDLQDMDCNTCPETQLTDKDCDDDEDGEDQCLKGRVSERLCRMSVRDGLSCSPQSRASPLEVKEIVVPDCDEEEVEEADEKKNDSSSSDVEEIHEVKSGSRPSADPSLSPQSTVNCPICQLSFPLADVEMHAAYCEGDKNKSADDSDHDSPVRPRKRRRKGAAESVQEKCYVCQTMVPLSSYSRHTQLCMQLSVKPARGTLLSALEQSDSADTAQRGSGVRPGPSGSRVQPCPSSSRVKPNDIIELQDDDDDDDEDSLNRIFTEATKSQVTFRRTQAQKPKR